MNDMSTNRRGLLPATAKGDAIYAIGDIHGRYDLWKIMVETIERHAAVYRPDGDYHIIVLGDMIDRGPDSARVIRSLRNMSGKKKATVLIGNHEDAMLRVLDGEPGMLTQWMRFGGDATLESFGIAPPRDADDYPRVAQEMRDLIPENYVSWLRRRPISVRSGDYLFCHAGIKPGVEIAKQKSQDMLWIRDEFLESDEAHGVVVVHGHSISPDVELRHNRIGVDTGAYRTGVLTAAFLHDTTCHILSTEEPAASAQATSPSARRHERTPVAATDR